MNDEGFHNDPQHWFVSYIRGEFVFLGCTAQLHRVLIVFYTFYMAPRVELSFYSQLTFNYGDKPEH